MARAIEDGITCLDTAEACGMGVSEEALAPRPWATPERSRHRAKFGLGYEEMPNRRYSSQVRVFAWFDKSCSGCVRIMPISILCIGPMPTHRSTRR